MLKHESLHRSNIREEVRRWGNGVGKDEKPKPKEYHDKLAKLTLGHNWTCSYNMDVLSAYPRLPDAFKHVETPPWGFRLLVITRGWKLLASTKLPGNEQLLRKDALLEIIRLLEIIEIQKFLDTINI